MEGWMQHFITLGLEGLEGLLQRHPTGRFCYGDSVTLADICLARRSTTRIAGLWICPHSPGFPPYLPRWKNWSPFSRRTPAGSSQRDDLPCNAVP